MQVTSCLGGTQFVFEKRRRHIQLTGRLHERDSRGIAITAVGLEFGFALGFGLGWSHGISALVSLHKLLHMLNTSK